jgi:hypothetical protein
VVVPAPELLSVNVAVGTYIEIFGAFRKGLVDKPSSIAELPSRPVL